MPFTIAWSYEGKASNGLGTPTVNLRKASIIEPTFHCTMVPIAVSDPSLMHDHSMVELQPATNSRLRASI